MSHRLALKLDGNVIKRAKRYASDKRIGLSGLIENYLDSLTKEEEIKREKHEISPFVKSISTSVSIPNETDRRELKKEYIDYLDKKYQ